MRITSGPSLLHARTRQGPFSFSLVRPSTDPGLILTCQLSVVSCPPHLHHFVPLPSLHDPAKQKNRPGQECIERDGSSVCKKCKSHIHCGAFLFYLCKVTSSLDLFVDFFSFQTVQGGFVFGRRIGKREFRSIKTLTGFLSLTNQSLTQ